MTKQTEKTKKRRFQKIEKEKQKNDDFQKIENKKKKILTHNRIRELQRRRVISQELERSTGY